MNLTPNAPSRFAAAGQTAWPAGSPNMSFKTADNGPARVGVAGAQDAKRLPELLAALAPALAVRFESRAPGNYEGLDAVILLGGTFADADKIHQAGRHCLHLPLGESPGAEIARTEIHFADNDRVPGVLRRRIIQNELAPASGAVQPPACMVMIAHRAPRARFGVARSTEGVRHDCSLLTLPPITSPGMRDCSEWLNAKRFVQGTAGDRIFMRFLVPGKQDGRPPPLRACFMFDDPNLHWMSYGCIDYRKLAAHALEHNYHVTFATIPLDAWLVHPATARFFAEHARTLSLLIHGNNHTLQELAQDYPPAQRAALLAQALTRIQRLEGRSGCRVSRVMAAPHGACSEAMMKDMARLGFEAACISHGSLRAHNRGRSWTRSLGLRVSEIVVGLPVLPRMGFPKGDQNGFLLAALLNQPIIAMGHHQDVGGGLDLLADMAAFINSLGPVQWLNTEAIARSNFSSRREAGGMRVKMWSRRIRLRVPAGIRQIQVELGGRDADSREEVWWHPAASPGPGTRLSESSAIACTGGEEMEILALPPQSGAVGDPARHPLPLRALARRLLSETRRPNRQSAASSRLIS